MHSLKTWTHPKTGEDSFKSALKLCGLSQRQAAEYLGVSTSSIDKWCRGQRTVPKGIWQELADLYRRIADAADIAAEQVLANGLDLRVLDDLTAGANDPLPEGAEAAAGAMALMIALQENAPDID